MLVLFIILAVSGRAVTCALVSYVSGPILGALLAAVLYAQIVLKSQERIEQRPIDTLS